MIGTMLDERTGNQRGIERGEIRPDISRGFRPQGPGRADRDAVLLTGVYEDDFPEHILDLVWRGVETPVGAEI